MEISSMTPKPDGRVLIVEDDAMVAEMIEGMVISQGYTVVGAVRDGRAAVEAVRCLHPDVVLMDLEMPEMGGVEATRCIQASCPTAVVVLTAYDDLDLTNEAAAAGVGAYLIKPVRGRDLTRAIMVAQARFREVQALSEMNLELTTQNQDLGAFAHTVAHDLKNALTPLVGLANLLGEDLHRTPVAKAQEQLDVIAAEGKKLGRMVDDLLLLAEVRDRDLAPTPLDMGAIVIEAQARVAHLVEELDAEILVATDWPRVLGYSLWVVEVWVNYLSNALKYGGSPPHVAIGWDLIAPGNGTAEPSPPPAYRFWVRDNGCGLTEEDQGLLFSPFVQLSPGDSQGYGLGLSIVSRIVRKLGGEVGVESTPDHGCTFWFTLRGA
jgi:two-component system, sensor histidine kinase and response regulator